MKFQDAKYFSIKTFNKTLFEMTYMIAKYLRELKLIDKKFRSTIMMAVTDVNGCSMCSYYHTKELINAGTSDEELKTILEGTYVDLETKESLALVFAEHYADVSGNYDKEAFKKVKEYYGEDFAYGILGTIKSIMFGNIYGIALGNIGKRFKFKKPKNSKFFTDLYIALAPFFLMFPFLIINLFRKRIQY